MTVPTTLFRPVIRIDSVTSTMDLLSSLAQDAAPSGTTVVADLQTGGRGRSGRAWTTPPGAALLMSTLLRAPCPLAECGVLAPLAGLAVARSIDSSIDSACEIKWPNDVLIEGRKVAGVLISARTGAPSDALPGALPESSVVIVGIGINVTTEPSALPPEATSVQQHARRPVNRTDLLDELGVALESIYADFCAGQVDGALVDVNKRLAFRDQEVIVEDGPREIRGRLRRVDEDGGLVLVVDGEPVTVRSGELTRGPRPVRAGHI